MTTPTRSAVEALIVHARDWCAAWHAYHGSPGVGRAISSMLCEANEYEERELRAAIESSLLAATVEGMELAAGICKGLKIEVGNQSEHFYNLAIDHCAKAIRKAAAELQKGAGK